MAAADGPDAEKVRATMSVVLSPVLTVEDMVAEWWGDRPTSPDLRVAVYRKAAQKLRRRLPADVPLIAPGLVRLSVLAALWPDRSVHPVCAICGYEVGYLDPVIARRELHWGDRGRGPRPLKCLDDLGICVEIDHIVPLAAGGEHKLSNLQLVHRPCNGSKGSQGARYSR